MVGYYYYFLGKGRLGNCSFSIVHYILDDDITTNVLEALRAAQRRAHIMIVSSPFVSRGSKKNNSSSSSRV